MLSVSHQAHPSLPHHATVLLARLQGAPPPLRVETELLQGAPPPLRVEPALPPQMPWLTMNQRLSLEPLQLPRSIKHMFRKEKLIVSHCDNSYQVTDTHATAQPPHQP